MTSDQNCPMSSSLSDRPRRRGARVFRHLFTALAEEMGAALRRPPSLPTSKSAGTTPAPSSTRTRRGLARRPHAGAPRSDAHERGGGSRRARAPGPGRRGVPQRPFPGRNAPTRCHADRPRVCRGGAARATWPRGRTTATWAGRRRARCPSPARSSRRACAFRPVRLYVSGRRNEDLWRTLLANVRTPVERAGDLDAQLAALNTGAKRLLEIAGRRGREETLAAMASSSRTRTASWRRASSASPTGAIGRRTRSRTTASARGPIPIRRWCSTVARLTLDFEGTSPQVPGGVNAVAAITSSAVRYVVRCVVEALLGESLPAGGGSMSAVMLKLPEGSVVSARPPARSPRATWRPASVSPTCSCWRSAGAPGPPPRALPGDDEQHDVGGLDPRSGEPFAYYETVGGGMGAGPGVAA
jgi:N-methylhydantoinase B